MSRTSTSRWMSGALGRVLDELNAPTDTVVPRRTGLQAELTVLDQELGRLTAAVAQGGDLKALLDGIQAREQRRRTLQAELAAWKASGPSVPGTSRISSYNNPSYAAFIGATKHLNWPTGPEHLALYSVGTGYHPPVIPEGDVSKQNKLQMAAYVASELMDDVNLLQNQLTQQMEAMGFCW